MYEWKLCNMHNITRWSEDICRNGSFVMQIRLNLLQFDEALYYFLRKVSWFTNNEHVLTASFTPMFYANECTISKFKTHQDWSFNCRVLDMLQLFYKCRFYTNECTILKLKRHQDWNFNYRMKNLRLKQCQVKIKQIRS